MTQLEGGGGLGKGKSFLLVSFCFLRLLKTRSIHAILNTCFNSFGFLVALQLTPPTTCHLKLSVGHWWLHRTWCDCVLPLGKTSPQKTYANIAGLFLPGLMAFNLMHPGLVSREKDQQLQHSLFWHMDRVSRRKMQGNGDGLLQKGS